MLQRLVHESPTQLPRFASARSGAVFEKLVYEEFQRRGDFEGQVFDLSVGKLEKLGAQELGELVRVDSLEGLYSQPTTRGLLFDRELVAIAVQELLKAQRLHAEIRGNLAGLQSRPTAGNTTEELVAQYRQLIEMNEGVLVKRFEQLANFAVADSFTAAARSDATAHLVELVPRIAPSLSEPARVDLRAFLRAAAAEAPSDRGLSALSQRW